MPQAIIFDEKPGGRRSSSNPPTLEIEYRMAGVVDSGVVKASALGLTPTIVTTTEGLLIRDNVFVDEDGFAQFTVTVTWTSAEFAKPPTGSYRFGYTTTGGTLHISHSNYPTVAVYNHPDNSPPLDKTHHSQAIAVNEEGKPEGTEIVVPAVKFSYTFRHPLGVVNEAFAIAKARVTGTVNETLWHGLKPGEALFLGSEGGDGSDSEAEATYHVVAQENLQNLIIGEVQGIAKDGHDFLWIWWKDDVVDNQLAKKTRAVFIERPYRRVNFYQTLGF